jgi:hypothetical protein
MSSERRSRGLPGTISFCDTDDPEHPDNQQKPADHDNISGENSPR